ncbi:MAG: hypothetical protein GY869_03345, partial [Planctomycetes bacterium]|nr:hypothetical protein [Planctomycetota bacterium]
VKDGKVIHQLRPVETYVLDQKGEPIITFDEQSTIRSAQTWRLNKDAAGVAEMSAHLGDLAKAPEGDVVIDPITIFTGEGFNSSGDIIDTYITTTDPNESYGSSYTMYLGKTSSNEMRPLIGVSNVLSEIGSDNTIHSASIELSYYGTKPTGPATSRAYKVSSSWYTNEVLVTTYQLEELLGPVVRRPLFFTDVEIIQ